MSKLSDYSKFDHLDSDSDGGESDGGGGAPSKPSSAAAAASSPPVPRGVTTKHPTIPDRYVFSHGNQKVYEWEQSLEEVTVYIDAPMSQLPKENTASYIIVNILAGRLLVGLKGGDRYFIDENTYDKVKPNESSWYLDDGVINIVLAKCFRGQTWEGVLRGHANDNDNDGEESGGQGMQESIDPITKQEMQRTLMLERFQEENPGFDFRDATFNGEVPDPRTFMGGVGYNH